MIKPSQQKLHGEWRMEPIDLLQFTHNVCTRLDLNYLVVGSTATIAYGEPRFTNDLDIVFDLPTEKIAEFCKSFPETEFYISKAAVELAVRKNFQFNVIHPASGLKIDFMVMSNSDFDRSRRKRGRQLPVFDQGTSWFASPEDVILKKMVYHKEGGSDKHLRDIAGVLRIQGSRIDRDYIQQWSVNLNVNDVWNAIANKESEDD